MQRGSFVWMHSFKYTFLWDILVLICRCCIVFILSASISIFHRMNFALETFFKACARNSGQHSAHFYRPGSSILRNKGRTQKQSSSNAVPWRSLSFPLRYPFSISTHIRTNDMFRSVRLQQKATKQTGKKNIISLSSTNVARQRRKHCLKMLLRH